MKLFLILLFLMGCASNSKKKQNNYSGYERKNIMKDLSNTDTTLGDRRNVLDLQIPLIWYVEKF